MDKLFEDLTEKMVADNDVPFMEGEEIQVVLVAVSADGESIQY